jgi:cytochrome c oxidase assembly protein subunit 15
MISQHALTAIHWVHRNFAFIVLVYLGILAWKLRVESGLRGPATLMLALLAAQVFTGLTTIFFQWPLLIAVLHNGGAAGLTLVSVVMLVRLANAGRPAPSA